MRKAMVQITGCTVEAGYVNESRPEFPMVWLRIKGPDGELVAYETQIDLDLTVAEDWPIYRKLLLKRLNALEVIHG